MKAAQKFSKEVLFKEAIQPHQCISHLTVERRRALFDGLCWPLLKSVNEAREKHGKQPLFVGISAPQGCGKTTTTKLLSAAYEHVGMTCVSMSLDDFYLKGDDQDRIAAKWPGNPLLQYRGNAGTHDLPLLEATLDELSRCKTSSSSVRLPRYEKWLRNGRGDRLPESQWSVVQGPVDVVLLEGWMLGFSAVRTQRGKWEDQNLEAVNHYLKDYSAVHERMDSWIVFAIDNPEYVYRWRLEAEHVMKATSGASLTDEQVRDFVARFMPAYHQYLPSLYVRGPERNKYAEVVKVTINAEREVVSIGSVPNFTSKL